MFEPQTNDAAIGSWWSRLTQAVLREPTVVLLEKDADMMRKPGDRDAQAHAHEAAR